MPRLALLKIALVLCSAMDGVASAQMKDIPPSNSAQKTLPTATVSGHVYLDDLKAPGRMAKVSLEPVAVLEDDAPQTFDNNSNPGPITAGVDTQFDGSYVFTHVAPGAYYVIATHPGYISPLTALSIARSDRKDAREKILRSLTRVEIEGDRSASGVDLTLERGSAISGNISYDDGAPAVRLRVSAQIRVLKDGKEAWVSVTGVPGLSYFPDILTDDRGNYRMSGLLAGTYRIQAMLEFSNTKTYSWASGSSAGSSNDHAAQLAFYSGNTPQEKDGKEFRIQAQEERSGEDIVIPISKLHTVKGFIVAARDGHVVNSGNVNLLRADDRSLAGSQSPSEDDPSFTFPFVFEGDYILNVPAAADVEYELLPPLPGFMGPPRLDAHVLHSYGTASKPLHVDRDMDRLTIAVPEPAPKDAQAQQNGVQ